MPGSLSLEDIAAYFVKHKFPRKPVSIGAFERGQIKDPPDRFFELYSQATGLDEQEVRGAVKKTQRKLRDQVRPFGRRKAA